MGFASPDVNATLPALIGRGPLGGPQSRDKGGGAAAAAATTAPRCARARARVESICFDHARIRIKNHSEYHFHSLLSPSSLLLRDTPLPFGGRFVRYIVEPEVDSSSPAVLSLLFSASPHPSKHLIAPVVFIATGIETIKAA